jgi:signal transduction histidine kinase
VTRRLVLSYLAIAILILLILAVPLAALAQRFERNLAISQADREANGLAAVVVGDLEDGQAVELSRVVARYQAKTGGEVTVVSPTGAPVASSSGDADDDAQGEWKGLTEGALAGQSAGKFTADEGVPFAVASVPVTDDGRSIGAVVLGTPATFTEHRIHQIWLAVAGFAAAALVVAAAVGVLLARSMVLPLGQLETAVDRLGHGDLGSRAGDKQGPSEIRSLARQFNQMANRLNELVEAQQRFVADASHQLRSPLTALRLRTENLEATADDRTAGAVAAVGRELQRLSRIVDGLLTLSRAGQEQPAAAEVDVLEVVNQRCDGWSALTAERGVELVRDFGPQGPLWCRLVAGDLDQILDNLLANASEVTPVGGHIFVRFVPSVPTHTEIHVVDEGPGLSVEERERAFDRFWQGRERSAGHSGLGLAIVRQLALRNGMAVELRPAQPHGLDAVVTLPLP